MEFEKLSGENKDSFQTVFILIDFVVIALLYFSALAALTSPWQIYFYAGFLFFLGTSPSIYDKYMREKDDILVDTVSIEDEDAQLNPHLASWRVQLGIGTFLAFLIGYQIFSTGAIYIQYPTFSLNIPFLTEQNAKIVGILFSALASSYVETRVFWSFVMPTIYNLINRKYDSIILSLLGSTVLTTAFFVGYHLFVYSNSLVALQSVAVFSLINCLLVIFLRSILSNFTVHFANNAVGNLMNFSRSIFGIVI